jgi:signal transduction histidine kinase
VSAAEGVLRVVCLADDAETIAVARESLATSLPAARFDVVNPAFARQGAPADCAIVDAIVGGRPGMEIVRELRAGGFDGAVVLLLESAPTSRLLEEADRLGVARLLDRVSLATDLGDAVVASSGDPVPAGTMTAARRELRRTQQLVAAGEIALGLQHALNNPLTALLAEAQLLEMEGLPPEYADAVHRIVELCRRTIGIVRQLDVVAPAPPART